MLERKRLLKMVTLATPESHLHKLTLRYKPIVQNL